MKKIEEEEEKKISHLLRYELSKETLVSGT
uniref:Uncharacterized protein n=1 Tax=Anguilla anguilla TaxID=7936 RepID=A0A0E9SAK2_ANGAN